jgi:hypothetical protein
MNIHKIWIIGYFILFSALFIFLTPVYEAPDEFHHLDYVNYVAQNLSLPNQLISEKTVSGEGHQFPLYYILAALIVRIADHDHMIKINPEPNKKHVWNGGQFHFVPRFKNLSKNIFHDRNDLFSFYLLRILSLVFGVINLLYIFKLSKLFFPDSKWQWFPPFFVASLPQFIFNSSYISNDGLSNLLATISLYYLFKIQKSKTDTLDFVLMGVFLGLGVLTKKSLLFLLPVSAVMLTYTGLRLRRTKSYKTEKFVKNVFLATVIFAILTGWLFIKNYKMYGDILGNQMEKISMASFGIVEEKPLFSSYFLRDFPPRFYDSFLATFGWMNLYLPKSVYIFYSLILVSSILGIIIFLKEEHFKNCEVYFSAIAILFCLGGIVYYNLTYSQPQGRLLFPVLGLISILIVLGITTILSKINIPPFRYAAMVIMIFLFMLIDVVSVRSIYNFYYNLAQYS